MKSSAVIVFVGIVLFGFIVNAAEPTPTPRTEGGVKYVSGGVGVDEVQALRSIQHEYNLRLLFLVQGSGEFLADVKVKIQDAKGKTVLDTVSDGPRFLAKLAPGSYRIIAESEGKQIIKSVRIPSKSSTSQSFFWKKTREQKPAQ
jgi:hypothetical protein